MTDGITTLREAGEPAGAAAMPRTPAPAGARAPSSDDSLFRNVRREMATPARPICCLAIDAEEDFDWARPVYATRYTTQCMQRITDLHEIVSAYGVKPTYLLTYPVMEDNDAVSMIRRQYARGECDIGIQLHPWVTPPFDEPANQASYLASLDPAVEERKLRVLIIRFRAAFGFDPQMFRAGRYGLSAATTGLLEKYGFTIDTSLAPRTDFRREGGPDFSDYDCEPFWFGERRRLLEVPLCRGLVGWSGSFAPRLYHAASATPLARWHIPAMLSRLRCAERVTLSPEGNDTAAMLRLLRGRQRRGQRVFTLSFHSSSLVPGRNPYVRAKPDLHIFYDRLSAILDAMASHGFDFASLADIPALLDNGH